MLVPQAAINRFITEKTQMPKPSIWTADLDMIVAAVCREHQVFDAIH
jgi:hypothetical protein